MDVREVKQRLDSLLAWSQAETEKLRKEFPRASAQVADGVWVDWLSINLIKFALLDSMRCTNHTLEDAVKSLRSKRIFEEFHIEQGLQAYQRTTCQRQRHRRRLQPKTHDQLRPTRSVNHEDVQVDQEQEVHYEARTVQVQEDELHHEVPLIQAQQDVFDQESRIVEAQENELHHEITLIQAEQDVFDEEARIVEVQEDELHHEVPLIQAQQDVFDQESRIVQPQENELHHEGTLIQAEQDVCDQEAGIVEVLHDSYEQTEQEVLQDSYVSEVKGLDVLVDQQTSEDRGDEKVSVGQCEVRASKKKSKVPIEKMSEQEEFELLLKAFQEGKKIKAGFLNKMILKRMDVAIKIVKQRGITVARLLQHSQLSATQKDQLRTILRSEGIC
eukprot:TRINITY_DN2431_c0_g2_i2.p1 TRINITY_DN2431_c0_g2~~TRINITY_DN2431_c0_g2_i2.p1  ORF type:complete len:387 (-),score=96.16 TRINITY_DN2431_c0_g2_i2:129-1289(-)